MGKTKLDHRVLAFGEKTHHCHEAMSETATLWDVGDGIVVLDAPDGSDVTHQEHHTVSVAPGQYDRTIVKEWDHFAEEAREVRD